MLRTLVSRFDGHNDGVPHEIHALERAGVVRVCVHVPISGGVAFPEAETIPWDFHYPWSPSSGFPSPQAPSHVIEKVEPALGTYLFQQARTRLDPTQAHLPLHAMQIHADLNLFYRFVGFLYEKLRQHEIELVLFDEIPHYGMDYALYLVARAMGIRTILFLQNVHTERTLVVEQIEETGRLMDRPVLSPPLRTEIPRGFRQPLYAPVDRRTNAVERQLARLHTRQVQLKTVVGLLGTAMIYLAELPLKWIRPGRPWLRGDRQNRILYEMMGVELRKLQARQSLDAAAAMAVREPDLDAPFVFFALHFQPELTTYPLGGEFMDQLRAVEHLRRMLPDDWRICVKEHPESFGALRDPHFYGRLRGIPGVQLVSAEVDSHVMLARCRFVATITGTVGWEAINGGKPVLTFGYAWYNGLPGVFRIADAPKWDEIADCEIDHGEVVERFAVLSTRFGDFTPAWGLEDRQLPSGFDRATNCQRFVESMKRLLS